MTVIVVIDKNMLKIIFVTIIDLKFLQILEVPNKNK